MLVSFPYPVPSDSNGGFHNNGVPQPPSPCVTGEALLSIPTCVRALLTTLACERLVYRVNTDFLFPPLSVPISPCSSVLCWRSRHFLLDAPSRSLAVTDAGDGFGDSGGNLSSWTTPGPSEGDPPGLSVTRVRLETCGIGELSWKLGDR